MTTPAIQNDLSYYRRTVMRQMDSQSPIGHESHAISLFYAIPTPMLKVVSEATTHFVDQVRSCSSVFNEFNSNPGIFFSTKKYLSKTQQKPLVQWPKFVSECLRTRKT